MNNVVVFRALAVACHSHREQTRKGTGEPYINHLVEVAELLVRVAGVDDTEILAAAVLHDIVEDTSTSAVEVEAMFGQRIRALVESLTDDKTLPKEQRKRLQIEHMRSASPEVRLIKLADHCSNVAALPADWDTGRKVKYLHWSEQVAGACAGVHLGMDREYLTRLAKSRQALPSDA